MFFFDTCIKFLNGIFHQKQCVFILTSHAHYLNTLGIFHSVTTHVENCYDSVLKLITLAKYGERSVHFKLKRA